MHLKYHQPTFDLIEREPLLDPAAMAQLDKCEAAYGFPFPASVQEWYSLAGAVDILREYSNEDHPVTLAELMELSQVRRSYKGWRDYHGLNVLPIIDENQSVALWAIHLDGSDDPPVLVIDDDNEWKPCADRFSEFITSWVWGFLYWGDDCPAGADCQLGAKDKQISAEDLIYLRQTFDEAPRRPDSAFYHFRKGEDAHIHVWARSADESRWILRAITKESLLEITSLVWRCGTLASTLEIEFGFIYGWAGQVLDILRLGHERHEPEWGAKRRGGTIH